MLGKKVSSSSGWHLYIVNTQLRLCFSDTNTYVKMGDGKLATGGKWQ